VLMLMRWRRGGGCAESEAVYCECYYCEPAEFRAHSLCREAGDSIASDVHVSPPSAALY
jgi:hypothetical protein